MNDHDFFDFFFKLSLKYVFELKACLPKNNSFLLFFIHNLNYWNLKFNGPTHNVPVRSHIHRVPVEGILGGPVGVSFMMFADKHNVPAEQMAMYKSSNQSCSGLPFCF